MDKETFTELANDHPEFAEHIDLLVAPPSAKEIIKEWGPCDHQFLSRCDEQLNGAVSRGAQYWLVRCNGGSDTFASMIALAKGPGLNTDDTFFHGSKPLYDQFGSQSHLDRYLKVAKSKGFTPPVNSTYFPGLARFQGDPEAFITRAMGRNHIKKLCERRGWECDGDVKVDHREPDSDPLDKKNCVPLADDIIRDRANTMAAKDPSIMNMKRSDLKQHIIDKHGPSK